MYYIYLHIYMCIYILGMRKSSVGNMQHKWHPSRKAKNKTEDKSKHMEKKPNNSPNHETFSA